MRIARAAGGRTITAIGVAAMMVGVVWVTNSVRDQDADDRGSRLSALFDDRRLQATGAPAERVALLQARLEADDSDPDTWAALGSAYLDQARRTGDPRWYPKAEASLERALDLEAGNVAALVGRSALAAARHDFADALDWADRAATRSADDPAVLGVRSDALLELGRYPEAFVAIQAMVDRRPDLAAYARVGYARELQGDMAGAEAAFQAARDSATNATDDAFATFHLGELAWNQGQVDRAAEHYRRARQLDPEFVPAQAALARIAVAQGRLDEATAGYEAVVERLPLPQFVAELGDLYAVSGRTELAGQQYELVAVQQRLARESGVNTDLESALFSADHGVDLAAGLAAAEQAWSRRPSIFAADALAWQLHAHGRDVEALQRADQALHLGTRSALFHFHRSRIHQALGHLDEARRDLAEALAINPHFSILHGPAASSTNASGLTAG